MPGTKPNNMNGSDVRKGPFIMPSIISGHPARNESIQTHGSTRSSRPRTAHAMTGRTA